MASKSVVQNIFGTQKVGVFSKLAPNFYKWELSPLPILLRLDGVIAPACSGFKA